MKNLILSFSALFITFVSYAQVGIGVTTPHASAALEVVATNNDKGILITRLTKSQRDAISAPATGLLVYQTDNSPGLYFFNGISWAAVGKDNLGDHTLSQALDLNGEVISDNTDATTELTLQSLIDNKDIRIKSYDEIYLTTVNGSGTTDPNGTSYSTFGDIELTSAGGIELDANEEVLIESGSGKDIDIIASDDLVLEALGDDVLIDADDDIKLNAGNDGSGEILVYDPIGSPSGDNIILDSGNDIELKVTSGDFVEIWEDGVFLYTLPGSRGAVGQFMQRSSDGSSEFYSDWSAYALPLADGTSGQILTTDGSGTVSWADDAWSLYTLPANDGTNGQILTTDGSGTVSWADDAWSGYTLPANYGTSGQILTTDGSGAVTWTTPSSGGASALNDLTDVIRYNTATNPSLTIGHSNTGTINDAQWNTAVGIDAFVSITTGDENTALGHGTLYSNTTGRFNTAVGKSALFATTTGSNNIAMGRRSLFSNTTGGNNIALGSSALNSNVTGFSNVAIGLEALKASTGTTENIAIGRDAMSEGNITAGYGNIAVGTRAAEFLAGNPVGVTAIGHEVLQSNQSGYTTAVGMQALESNTTGFSNDAFGYIALQQNTTGGQNVAIGRGALNSITVSSSNTAIGNGSAFNVTSGNYSVFVGNSAGSSTTAKALGNGNIYIGAGSKPSVDGVENEIVIGRNAVGTGSNTITLGHTTNTAVYARGTVYSNGTALTSDRRLKSDIKSVANGLSTVMKLNPVSYNKRLSFDTEEYNKKEIGFIAQEVQEILPDLVSEGPDENKTLSLDYNSLIPILTKAIQEQQVLIEALKAKVEKLESNN